MFTLTAPLVLASASPRRRDLLAEVGIIPEILPAEGLDGFVEPMPELGEKPECYAVRCAEAKARVVAAHRPQAVVLAADTIVVRLEPGAPVVMGKPASIDEALFMLTRLAGQTHQVITGCALLGANGTDTGVWSESFHLVTDVEFLNWPEHVLRAYAQTGEGLDKAGAYAIQGKGGFLCSCIRGSWSNVVGLPVSVVLQRLYARKVLR